MLWLTGQEDNHNKNFLKGPEVCYEQVNLHTWSTHAHIFVSSVYCIIEASISTLQPPPLSSVLSSGVCKQ